MRKNLIAACIAMLPVDATAQQDDVREYKCAAEQSLSLKPITQNQLVMRIETRNGFNKFHVYLHDLTGEVIKSVKGTGSRNSQFLKLGIVPLFPTTPNRNVETDIFRFAIETDGNIIKYICKFRFLR